MKPITAKRAERFWRNVQKTNGCWTYLGYRHRQGYGRTAVGGQLQLAHRVSWTILVGDIPDGAHLLHACDNPVCVNPAHLRLGTHAENMADMVGRGRLGGPAARNGVATHCIHGHPFAGDNLRVLPSGERRCRACANARSRRSRRAA